MNVTIITQTSTTMTIQANGRTYVYSTSNPDYAYEFSRINQNPASWAMYDLSACLISVS